MISKFNVEAENDELVMQNSHGDYAIIPADMRDSVQGMLKSKDYEGIDKVVSGLPKLSNYAMDGSVIPDPDPPSGPPSAPSFDPEMYDRVSQEMETLRMQLDTEKNRVKDVRGKIVKFADNRATNKISTRTDLGWIDVGRNFCNAHSCEILKDAGTTTIADTKLSGTSYAKGSGMPLIPGNMQFMSEAGTGSLGLKRIDNPDEFEAGDVVQLLRMSSSDYQGNEFGREREIPKHSMIYSGKKDELDRPIMYEAVMGRRDNYSSTPYSTEHNKLVGWRYEGDVPNYEKSYKEKSEAFAELTKQRDAFLEYRKPFEQPLEPIDTLERSNEVASTVETELPMPEAVNWTPPETESRKGFRSLFNKG